MVHFGVKLHGIKIARGVGGDRKRRIGGGAIDLKPRSQFADVIAVGHPDLFVALRKPAIQQGQGVGGFHKGTAKFSRATAARDFTPLNLTAQFLHHDLLAIADAQDRYVHVKHRCRWARGALTHHTVGAT